MIVFYILKFNQSTIWVSALFKPSKSRLKKSSISAVIKQRKKSYSLPAKVGLNKKSFPKQKTIQNFTIDAQGFRKTKNENPPTWEIEVTS